MPYGSKSLNLNMGAGETFLMGMCQPHHLYGGVIYVPYVVKMIHQIGLSLISNGILVMEAK